MLHGVDVTRSRFLSRAQVIAAVDFAAAAHAGQVRLTGDAYVVHVIKTAVIVEGLLANSARSFTLGERLVSLIMILLRARGVGSSRTSMTQLSHDVLGENRMWRTSWVWFRVTPNLTGRDGSMQGGDGGDRRPLA